MQICRENICRFACYDITVFFSIKIFLPLENITINICDPDRHHRIILARHSLGAFLLLFLLFQTATLVENCTHPWS